MHTLGPWPLPQSDDERSRVPGVSASSRQRDLALGVGPRRCRPRFSQLSRSTAFLDRFDRHFLVFVRVHWIDADAKDAEETSGEQGPLGGQEANHEDGQSHPTSRACSTRVRARGASDRVDGMSAAAKLQIKSGHSVAVVSLPPDVDLEMPDDCHRSIEPDTADAVVWFVANRSGLDAGSEAVMSAAGRNALAWIAYPKAGQLGTDLNRDSLNDAMRALGVQAVRQVAINEVWSALRFRSVPGQHPGTSEALK